MRDIAARCANCSADLGRLSDPDQAERVRRHFVTCTQHLDGDGLIPESQIAWDWVEDDHG